MTYWKIAFTEGREGYGWLAFDSNMVSTGLFDEQGAPVTEPVGYHPVLFDITPDWA